MAAQARHAQSLGRRGSQRALSALRRADRPPPGGPPPGILLRLLRLPRSEVVRLRLVARASHELASALLPHPLPPPEVLLDPRRRAALEPERVDVRLVDDVPEMEGPLDLVGHVLEGRAGLFRDLPPDLPGPRLQVLEEFRLRGALPYEERVDGHVLLGVPLEG